MRIVAEIPLHTGVATVRAEMDEVRQRLHASGALVEIGALATKGVGGNDGLRAKERVADGTGQFDEMQRGHGTAARDADQSRHQLPRS